MKEGILYFFSLTDYFNQNWTVHEIEKLIETLHEKLKKNRLSSKIDWVAWNYPTFTNAILN
jgi:hypothetical protein